MSQTTKPAEFGKWRSMLWPVHAYELKKFIPMLLLMFFINFNYTILRDTKDALIVTAPGSGAHTLPFLKVWGVLPLAIVFMLIYAKLSNVLSKTKLFYTTICGFLAFFALFALVLYPARDFLHPTELADKMQAALPQGLSGLVSIFRNWTFSLFYIMSELWGSMAMSLLFWGFANDTTRISESKRFYAMFGIGANLAMLPSGQLIKYFAKVGQAAGNPANAWGMTLNSLTLLVMGAGAMVMVVYWWMNKYILTDSRFYDPSEVKKGKKKPKMPLKESFAYLLKSKYLLCIALLVIGYGVAIQLVEVTWKYQVGLKYPTPNEYVGFMGTFSQLTSLLTLFMMLFVGGNVIRKFGWKTGALFTPVVLLVTGVAFFAFVIFKGQLGGLITALGTSPLVLAVIFGTVQNIMSKSTKYSLFDPTKEMAYIPLDQESKVKGKAAIDVVGARFGKAGGALINQGLIFAVGGSVALIAPYVAVVMLAILGVWIAAARSLGNQFQDLSAQREAEAAAEAAAKETVPAEEPETAKSPQPTS